MKKSKQEKRSHSYIGIVVMVSGLISATYAKENRIETLQKQCLSCHQAQQVPSEMIYRRYLMRFSSKKIIKEKMFSYLKCPSTNVSIMPAPFFKKFPLKKVTSLDDKRLEALIDEYIMYYDINDKIVIFPKEED